MGSEVRTVIGALRGGALKGGLKVFKLKRGQSLPDAYRRSSANRIAGIVDKSKNRTRDLSRAGIGRRGVPVGRGQSASAGGRPATARSGRGTSDRT